MVSLKKNEIPRRANVCSHCQNSFFPGSLYFSALLDGDKEGSYIRLDYHPDCRDQNQLVPPPHSSRSFWKAKIPVKRPLSELPKQRDARSLYLLKEALALDAQEARMEAFVLSLYLSRKRKIVLREDRFLSDGQKASLYEVYETEEMLLVPKISLSDLEVEKIQAALALKLAS